MTLPDSAGPASPTATAADARERAERLLKSGAPLLAFDVLAEALTRFPGDVRLRQLLGLALSRTGASRAALGVLGTLEHEGHTDEETLGLLARAHKDIWMRERASREAAQHLRRAYDYYRLAYRHCRGFWTGINAAALALLLGDREQSTTLARSVRSDCEERRRAGGDPDYWVHATLGEAALILGDRSGAEAAYGRAFELAKGRPADLAATRRNARLIATALGVDGLPLDEWLPIRRVVVFAGHLIDRPGRPTPRFPPELEGAARNAILSRLDTLDAGFGYASAASGGDLLFLECLDDIEAESTIVLPYNSEQFVADSVATAGGAAWTDRYHQALARAREVIVASEQRMAGGELSYEYAMLLLDGMAGIHADELDTDSVAMALWDGRPGDGPGGTAATVEWWRSGGRRLEIIDLAALQRAPIQVTTERPASVTARPALRQLEPRIVSLLFADARGFSKLTEPQVPQFVEHFLGAVARALERSPHQPVLKNTWGDGLYFVFDSVDAAGAFALDLSAAVNDTDWTAYGLPPDLTLRIGLHAGPAYACLDPITGLPNFLGAHVSRAARIEPITPPGQVYASRAFAALARAHRASGFTCEYVGRASLPKNSGQLPLYLVRRLDSHRVSELRRGS